MEETDLWAKQLKEEEDKGLWDMSVANAMANENVSMEIKKNS